MPPHQSLPVSLRGRTAWSAYRCRKDARFLPVVAALSCVTSFALSFGNTEVEGLVMQERKQRLQSLQATHPSSVPPEELYIPCQALTLLLSADLLDYSPPRCVRVRTRGESSDGLSLVLLMRFGRHFNRIPQHPKSTVDAETA